jgi:hypothetical protein
MEACIAERDPGFKMRNRQYDDLHHLLRNYIPAEGKLVTFMGDGKPGTGGIGGPPEKAQLKNPQCVLFHNGAIHVADSGNDRVLKISAD